MEGTRRSEHFRHVASSTLSLPLCQDKRQRRLLLIYIHGFMGSEASFHDFPAHVHDLLTTLLHDSHVVYTRIYPRYKSQGEMRKAVSQFSSWLSPHEADDLDVILLGHSLGGILAADVALLRAQDASPRHRILGLVNFDVPFLGLHPRVIPTGIWSSVAQKEVAPEDQLADEQESLGMAPAYGPVTPHPNFDPPFRNDVHLTQRGFFKGLMHFINKNASNLDTLSNSIVDRLMSPMKHAGCVNNYSELRERHQRLIGLENARSSSERVRFINYYTASTGRIKPAKPPKPEKSKAEKPKKPKKSKKSTKKQSKESSDRIVESFPGDAEDDYERLSQPLPQIQIDDSQQIGSVEDTYPRSPTRQPPEIPTTFRGSESYSSLDVSSTEARSSLTSVSTESLLLDQSISSRTSQSSIETNSLSITSSETLAPETVKAKSPDNVSATSSQFNLRNDTSPQKLRKFILLPSHHWKWNDDSHWTPVRMHDMTEVTAHQSMFVPRGSNYDYLVGDTVALIETWIQDDLSRRLMQESLD
ncbi:hypothetical protein N7539_005056 [Penicillium diatomitis]|uniref:AB hydrolase-1 domain-containing protein n=1 Tax=Penicillium diatomitis TaxID=2819901 RepID=A0A9X0BUD5_9EURO|nr:uncharacterized protein N7539_005056 [Penicillium diatomitis]KAJ5485068.1 hypothetical protein N7539_005056 [Penicillium diatomitis]